MIDQAPPPSPPPARRYYTVPLARVAATTHTHVCTVGTVVYRRRQQDGDWHITITDAGGQKVVLEIIPLIPLPPPSKGARIRACGITRIDKDHGWAELHPLESWTAAPPPAARRAK